MDKVPMTPEGHAALKQELTHLKTVERPKISKEIGVAREHGDLRENAEYHAAKDKQGLVEARIVELEDKIARAEVIDTSRLGGSRVAFGAWVTLADDAGTEVTYRIVGADESNLDQGTISVTSPMARALINREVGDDVKVNAPGGVRTFEVVDIRWSAS
ncbi:MAG: transcription elongation factor GreA [Sandaracinaceae bacterium]|nr:transcription elongation factor GreA [Sandaracinaceae bacterium]